MPTRSKANMLKLLQYIEQHPIIETVRTAAALGLSRNGMAKYIDIFCSKGILVQTSKIGKSLVFSYEEYLDILRKGTL